MTSRTAALLTRGGFDVSQHDRLSGDIIRCMAEDPQSWPDMEDVIVRVHGGRALPDDWDAPLWHRRSDIGEFRMQIGDRYYRLYVHAPGRPRDLLLLLHFDWKPGGSRGLVIQDNQIEEAYHRLQQWKSRNP